MAAAGLAMQIVGGGIQAGGDILKGQMTANSLRAQAEQQRVQAEEATQAGQYNAFRSQLQATQVLGHNEAAYGASGVTSSSTSVNEVLRAGATNAELDRQNIIHGADIKAINYKNEASLEEFGANSALEGSYFAAIGDILGSSKGVIANASSSGASGVTAGG